MTSSILLKPHSLYSPLNKPQLDPASYFHYANTHYENTYNEVLKRAFKLDSNNANSNSDSLRRNKCDLMVKNEISAKNGSEEMSYDLSSSQSSANNFVVQSDKGSTENEVSSLENNLNNSVSSTSSISNSNTNSASINLSSKSSKSKKKKVQFISDEALNEFKHENNPVMVDKQCVVNIRPQLEQQQQHEPSKMSEDSTRPAYFPASKKSNSLNRTSVNYYICQSKTIPCISSILNAPTPKPTTTTTTTTKTNSLNMHSQRYVPLRSSVNFNNNYASFIKNTNNNFHYSSTPHSAKSNSLRTMPNSKTMPVISNFNTYYSYRVNNTQCNSIAQSEKDNPFRPEGELAREADEIVQQLKQKAEQEVNQILNQASFSSNENSSQLNAPSLTNNKRSDVVVSGGVEVKPEVLAESTSQKVVVDTTPATTPTPTTPTTQNQTTTTTTTNPPTSTEHNPLSNNNNNLDEQEKLIKRQKTKKTKPKCGCVLS